MPFLPQSSGESIGELHEEICGRWAMGVPGEGG